MIDIVRGFALVLLLTPVSLVAKNAPGIADFQQSVELSEAKKRFRSFDLPAEVLYTLQRADMGDLRVFDKEGRAMPILILRKNADTVSELKRLRFYPLPGKPNSADPLSGVDIERNTSGDVIRIHPRKQPPDNTAELPITQYLLENLETKTDMDQLVFDWSQNRKGQVSLTIEHSDNLVQWRSLLPKAVLARLQHNGDQLEQNSVALPASNPRFLRLTLLDADADFSIREVSARYRPSTPPVQNWLLLGALQKQPEDAGVYGFTIQSAVKPDKIQLQLPDEAEFYLSGKLFSRPNEKSVWRLRNRNFVQYAVKQGSQWFNSEALSLGYVTDPFYRLELNNGQDVPAAQQLQIKLLMPSYEVVFIAAGKAPFTLAWGNAELEPDNYSMESLFEQFKQRTDDLEIVQLERTLY
ncbi:MAG: DUF3999 domain-containing protein, partial [Gammaproteobacteria bacterium]|nr:DUF3999 domain-containing protein [Gammaproteobacteria bacterium]